MTTDEIIAGLRLLEHCACGSDSGKTMLMFSKDDARVLSEARREIERLRSLVPEEQR